MLADQFHEAADGARTGAALDELARKLWRAHCQSASKSDPRSASKIDPSAYEWRGP